MSWLADPRLRVAASAEGELAFACGLEIAVCAAAQPGRPTTRVLAHFTLCDAERERERSKARQRARDERLGEFFEVSSLRFELQLRL